MSGMTKLQERTTPETPGWLSSSTRYSTRRTTSQVAPLSGTQRTSSYRSGRSDTQEAIELFREQSRKFNNPYDTGHEFMTEKRFAIGNFPQVAPVNTSTDYWSSYYPILDPMVKGTDDQKYPRIPTWDSFASDGNKFILSSSPTAPAADTLVSFAEIAREGIPSIIGTGFMQAKARSAKILGDEYLNIAFGWTPFIKAIQDIAQAVIDSEKIIKQYQRDSGRVVRRRILEPPVFSTLQSVETSSYYWSGQALTPYPVRRAYYTRTYTTMDQLSFSGAFTYHLAEGNNLLAKAERFSQLANKLLGTRLTPDVLWNLAPWSWLIDWVSNVGDNITAASAFTNDQLVLRHGYVMKHSQHDFNYAVKEDKISLSKSIPAFSITMRNERKERKKATPFGFGLNVGSFTAQQWSILVALGMTKGDKILR